MTDREFIQAVRRRAGLDADQEAESATLAVLARLAGRLSIREQRDLGSVLPTRLRRALLSAPNTDLQYAPAATFVRDVAEELYVTHGRARDLIHAVGGVLIEFVSPDELRDLRAELHDTFQAVFQWGAPPAARPA